MTCFFSIGFDATITLQFHELRETRPDWCTSRAINKLWHVRFGLSQLFSSSSSSPSSPPPSSPSSPPPSRSPMSLSSSSSPPSSPPPPPSSRSPLSPSPSPPSSPPSPPSSPPPPPSSPSRPSPFSSRVRLVVDGDDVALPDSIQTVQIFNVHSSADGTDFFGLGHVSNHFSDRLQTYRQPTVNDGLLEVVGTDGVMHLLMMKTGLVHAHRLAQGKEIKIIYLGEELIAVQHDGQPSWRKRCVIHIKHKNKINMILGQGRLRGVE
eukprot:TRINITY_DN4482_c1_g2_i1.p1 TRINITY_DN4482_c1_g2~~TRINITY_DN4482_c1_g2_i1.p1  ORF type:complete len:277 (+),score=47.04 TRINITY_DN4482_c1_g2_i1:39-833(+)